MYTNIKTFIDRTQSQIYSSHSACVALFGVFISKICLFECNITSYKNDVICALYNVLHNGDGSDC